MKSNRLFTVGALFGAISIAMPLYARAANNSIMGDAQKIYTAGELDTEDAGLSSKIKTALAIDPITKNAKIHVTTANGIVNLTGDVSNRTVIEEATEIAQNTEHVKAVLNNLQVDRVSNATFEM